MQLVQAKPQKHIRTWISPYNYAYVLFISGSSLSIPIMIEVRTYIFIGPKYDKICGIETLFVNAFISFLGIFLRSCLGISPSCNDDVAFCKAPSYRFTVDMYLQVGIYCIQSLAVVHKSLCSEMSNKLMHQ